MTRVERMRAEAERSVSYGIGLMLLQCADGSQDWQLFGGPVWLTRHGLGIRPITNYWLGLN